MSTISWDSYFMTMAYLVSAKSKDPSTRVGSVIVSSDNQIIATGYNGLPRGLEDTKERYEKPLKYQLISHAEENCILQCARSNISAKGSKIYVPWCPCSNCSKLIVQAGITEVIIHKQFPGNENLNSDWSKSFELTKEILNECGVGLRVFDGELVKIEGLYSGENFDLYDNW